VGAVQRLATVVVFGLVAIAAVLILYIADESNRRDSQAQAQEEAAIERATQTFLSQCLACHGPAGEGVTAPGEAGTGRIGLPIGGDTSATSLNQTGLRPDGTLWSDPANPQYGSGLEGRANYIENRIHTGARNADGSYRMPAFGAEFNGPLNDTQIEELVVFIQNGEWNHVYNEAIEVSGGYPTPPPAPETADQQDAAAGSAGQSGDEQDGPSTEGQGPASDTPTIELVMVDLAFQPAELTIPANVDVTLNLVNQGVQPHAFQLADGSIASDEIEGGGTGSVVVNLPAGEYDFICPVPGHADAGMVGKLIVEEGQVSEATPGASPVASPEGSPDAAGGGEAGTTGTGPVEVDMLVTLAFDPPQITIAANTDVTITAVNLGSLPHTFTIPDVADTGEVAGSSSADVVVNLPPGEYQFICAIPGHADGGMVGTLIVE